VITVKTAALAFCRKTRAIKGAGNDRWQRRFRRGATALALAGAIGCSDGGDISNALDPLQNPPTPSMSSSPATVTPTLALVPSDSYLIDNGDGTMTDRRTRLQWERKSDDGGVHDVDNLYTWSAGAPWTQDGTVATTFLVELNTPPCFAGVCDWRLPTLDELATLVEAGSANPAVMPELNRACSARCTVTACSCTRAGYYWSSTGHASVSQDVWCVDFASGQPRSGSKTDLGYARAVRGPAPPPSETPSPSPTPTVTGTATPTSSPTASPTFTSSPSPTPALQIQWINPESLSAQSIEVSANVKALLAQPLASMGFNYSYRFSARVDDSEEVYPLVSGLGVYDGVTGEIGVMVVLELNELLETGQTKLVRLIVEFAIENNEPVTGARLILVTR